MTVPSASSATKARNSHLNLDTFSPVNQNGSFEFDRVLKSGYVEKRTRRTKVSTQQCLLTLGYSSKQAWKPIYLVLRPNLLSIYKDQNEAKLRHKIHVSDLTAVAFLKDPKQKRQNIIGLFTPSRNYHLEATSKKDAEEWVDLIRREARIDQEEEEMFLASPGGRNTDAYIGFERTMRQQNEQRMLHEERVGSSSPEPGEPFQRGSYSRGHLQRRPSHLDYSGNEVASHSDMSDAGGPVRHGSLVSVIEPSLASQPPNALRPTLAAHNQSQLSGLNIPLSDDPERVIWQGHLLYLKSKRGVRQWKDLWAVLRPRNLALYKNESEYSPVLIVPLGAVIDVVEIDPVSRTKRLCLQVITEDKSYRFCALGEEDIDRCLGAFKSLLAKRREGEGKRGAVR